MTRTYQSWNSDLAYLKARLTDDYVMDFEEKYYPLSRKEDLQSHQEIQYFSKGQPPKVVPLPADAPTNTALYRMEGQITLQSRAGHNLQNLWTKPVALEITVRHVEGMGYRVEKVTEVTPAPVQKAENSADPLKAVQDAVGAVKNVADSVDKVDQTKKLLGL